MCCTRLWKKSLPVVVAVPTTISRNASSTRLRSVISITAPIYSTSPDRLTEHLPRLCRYLIEPSGRSSRYSPSKSLFSFTSSHRICSTFGRSSGWTRLINRGYDGLSFSKSKSKMSQYSRDQDTSPLRTFQCQLPVWLNLCACARELSLRFNATSARLRFVMSLFVSRNPTGEPFSSRCNDHRLAVAIWWPSFLVCKSSPSQRPLLMTSAVISSRGVEKTVFSRPWVSFPVASSAVHPYNSWAPRFQ